MAFDYEHATKNAYKSAVTASTYHRNFAGALSWRTFRFHFIARREVAAVARLLGSIKARKVLDIPCGTGKLASLLEHGGYHVTAADISNEMLRLAQASYTSPTTTFVIADVERLGDFFQQGEFDVVVCLRLMQRVPSVLRARMLAQIARTARYAVVSFGVKSPYHRIRKQVRRLILRTPCQPLCLERLSHLRKEMGGHFRVLRHTWVSRPLSEEVIFLLESKAHA